MASCAPKMKDDPRLPVGFYCPTAIGKFLALMELELLGGALGPPPDKPQDYSEYFEKHGDPTTNNCCDKVSVGPGGEKTVLLKTEKVRADLGVPENIYPHRATTKG